MPEISIKIAKEHHRYEHTDLQVMVDGEVYWQGRYARESLRHIMHVDNRAQLMDVLVALLLNDVITDRDLPLAAAQNRANNMVITI